jgi:hypothetical protein
MAAPVAAFVQLPLDSGNTGKMVQTTSRVVGANTVHRHHYVPDRASVVLGVYGASSPLQSVQAAAHVPATSAFAYLHVPIAVTGKKARIRRLIARHNVSAATPTMLTLPRIALARATFTGAASGAALTPEKLDSTYPTQVLDIRTAVTGLTLTAGGILATSMVPAFILAGTAASAQMTTNTVDPVISIGADEDEWPTVAPGQALVLYQADAGTAADTRRFTFDVIWDEIDTA